MKRGIFKPTYIPVSEGDVVLIRNIFNPTEEFKAEVLKVDERPGLINRETMARAPLLEVKNTETGEIKRYDNSFVAEIIKKYDGPIHLPRNIFRERVTPKMIKMISTDRKGIICGPLCDLATVTLAKLPVRLPYDINVKGLKTLYDKQKLGFIKAHLSLYWVHRKSFEKWVRRNAYKICKTRSQVAAENTAVDRAFEDEYWADYERTELKRSEQNY